MALGWKCVIAAAVLVLALLSAVWISRVRSCLRLVLEVLAHTSWKTFDLLFGGLAAALIRPWFSAATSAAIIAGIYALESSRGDGPLADLVRSEPYLSSGLLVTLTALPALKIYAELAKLVWEYRQHSKTDGRYSFSEFFAERSAQVLWRLIGDITAHVQSKEPFDMGEVAAKSVARHLSEVFSCIPRSRGVLPDVLIFEASSDYVFRLVGHELHHGTNLVNANMEVCRIRKATEITNTGKFTLEAGKPETLVFVLEDLWFERYRRGKRKHDGHPERGSAIGYGYLSDDKMRMYSILIFNRERRAFRSRERRLYTDPLTLAVNALELYNLGKIKSPTEAAEDVEGGGRR